MNDNSKIFSPDDGLSSRSASASDSSAATRPTSGGDTDDIENIDDAMRSIASDNSTVVVDIIIIIITCIYLEERIKDYKRCYYFVATHLSLLCLRSEEIDNSTRSRRTG